MTMALALIGLLLGGSAGFVVGKLWAAVVVILAPVPWYLGVALGLWGNGFGENWQYGIPIWIAPVCLGFVIGVAVKNVTGGRRPQGRHE